MQTHTPIQIARLFLEKSKYKHRVTSMKLNKLVYIAHGWALGVTGEPLINEDVQAWKYGPVVRSLYHAFKHFKNSPIPPDHATTISRVEQVDSDTKKLVKAVWEAYKDHPAHSLSILTHEVGTPWYTTWHDLKGRNRSGAVIDNSLIKKYYEKWS